MGTVSNVSAGKANATGAVYRADLPLASGVSLPTSASTTISGFDNLGYVSADGLTNNNTPGDETKAWGGDVVLHTGKEDTFTFTLIEAKNANVLITIYGEDNVEVDATTNEITVNATLDDLDPSAWIIDMLLRSGMKKRIVIPSGTISELSEISYKDDEIIGYGITIKANADDDGNTHFEYLLPASSS